MHIECPTATPRIIFAPLSATMTHVVRTFIGARCRVFRLVSFDWCLNWTRNVSPPAVSVVISISSLQSPADQPPLDQASIGESPLGELLVKSDRASDLEPDHAVIVRPEHRQKSVQLTAVQLFHQKEQDRLIVISHVVWVLVDAHHASLEEAALGPTEQLPLERR
jgi:hypothetical protein